MKHRAEHPAFQAYHTERAEKRFVDKKLILGIIIGIILTFIALYLWREIFCIAQCPWDFLPFDVPTLCPNLSCPV